MINGDSDAARSTEKQFCCGREFCGTPNRKRQILKEKKKKKKHARTVALQTKRKDITTQTIHSAFNVDISIYLYIVYSLIIVR